MSLDLKGFPLEAIIYLTPSLNCSSLLLTNHYYQRVKSGRSLETLLPWVRVLDSLDETKLFQNILH